MIPRYEPFNKIETAPVRSKLVSQNLIEGRFAPPFARTCVPTSAAQLIS